MHTEVWKPSRSTAEVAWAAGFFDGEGSIYVRNTKRHKGGNGKHYPLLTVEASIAQTVREPLDRFALLFAFGRVVGPYAQSGAAQNDYYRWQCGGRPSVHELLCVLWPHLSEFTKDKARKAWEHLRSAATIKSPKLPELPGDSPRAIASAAQEWYGVDLDGTLATDWPPPYPNVGQPVALMVARVKQWLAEGKEVRIVTARLSPERYDFGDTAEDQRAIVEAWTLAQFGVQLKVQAYKDHGMQELWDDRAVGVQRNTGKRLTHADTRGCSVICANCGEDMGKCICERKTK